MQIVVRPMGWTLPHEPQVTPVIPVTGFFPAAGVRVVLSSVFWHPKVPQALNDAYGLPVFVETPAGIALTVP